MTWVREHAGRGALLIAVALSIWSATTLQARQDDLADAQKQIRHTAAQADVVAERLSAFQSELAVTRILATDQRCESVAIDVEILRDAPRSLSAAKRENYSDCLAIRRTYMSELTPPQRAEYERRAERANR